MTSPKRSTKVGAQVTKTWAPMCTHQRWAPVHLYQKGSIDVCLDKRTLVHMGYGALVFPHQRWVPVYLHHRATPMCCYQKRSMGVPLQKWNTNVCWPKYHWCTWFMELECTQTLKRALVGGAPLTKKITNSSAQISMSTSTPLQVWITNVFFGQKNTSSHGSWSIDASKQWRSTGVPILE